MAVGGELREAVGKILRAVVKRGGDVGMLATVAMDADKGVVRIGCWVLQL